ncbi:MAG: redoxin domain-containing protein [Planctomycetes bacterium]|nr:redoxin domain-containing protein [Planctomycetota bacterium]
MSRVLNGLSAWKPALVAPLVFLLAGCQTPERRSALDRMDKLQAENSSIKASAQTTATQAQLDAAKQRQEDMKVIEALNARIDELSKQIEALKSAPRTEGPKETPKEQPAESPKPDQKVQAELERAKADAKAQLAKMEEDLAKAQVQAEAAKLAAASVDKRAAEGKKEADWKGGKLPVAKFVDAGGKLVDLASFTGKKTVVLVFMKGFYSQGICLYCTRQTAELAKTAKDFNDAGAEILVVYPGAEEHINAFVKSVREYEKSDDPRFQLPFKVLLDINQDVVRALKIDGDLAHPTSFILDKDGVVRFQYVGRSLSDRPKAAALLEEAKKIAGGAKP